MFLYIAFTGKKVNFDTDDLSICSGVIWPLIENGTLFVQYLINTWSNLFSSNFDVTKIVTKMLKNEGRYKVGCHFSFSSKENVALDCCNYDTIECKKHPICCHFDNL